MALIPKDRYPGQLETGSSWWPLGKAKNRSTVGDNDGTPLERDWLNDLFGFQQALLAQAGIAASGNPDHVGASQYVDAIETMINAGTTPIETRLDAAEGRLDGIDDHFAAVDHTLFYYAAFGIKDEEHGDGFRFGLDKIVDVSNNFPLSSEQITVPVAPAWYEVTISGHGKVASTAPNAFGDVWVSLGGAQTSPSFVTTFQRAGSSAAERANFHRTAVVRITNKTSQRISVQSGTAGLSIQDAQLIIRRVG